MSDSFKQLLLLPDVGDLLRFYPQYNAATVVEVLQHLKTQEVLWATTQEPDHPLRDALPTVNIKIQDGFSNDWTWANAEYEQLESFLNQYPQGRERLSKKAHAQMQLSQMLLTPLTPTRLIDLELQKSITEYHQQVKEYLDEGPGTHWRQRRLDELTQALQGKTGVALVALDDLWEVEKTIPHAQIYNFTDFSPSESSRIRALANRGWQLEEDDDLAALLDSLVREEGDNITPKPELDAAAANIYVAVGELNAAREMLEKAAHALKDSLPRSLAGLVLARLGQVRDALGDRELAVRTYRAVLALNYVPQVAKAAAEQGLKHPFELELGEKNGL